MKRTTWIVVIGFAIASFSSLPLVAQKAAERQTQTPPSTEKKAGAAQRMPDVIYVPTPQPVVEKMLEMAQVKPGDVVYDLGCGDGRIVVTAAKKYGVKAVGFDIDPQRIKESRENVRTNGVSHLVSIQQADIFMLDLTPASVITLYLLPSLNVKLIPQLEKLKPGSRIVSQSFAMEGVRPNEIYQNGGYTVYKWVTPLNRDLSPTGHGTGYPSRSHK